GTTSTPPPPPATARSTTSPSAARAGTYGCTGPVPLTLGPPRTAPPCPRCGSAATRLTSEFGATACKALYRCTGCLEPFEHVKEI
ncbi:hypothetical protein AB0M50_46080, partial [Nonomuraea fuscirosea]|uniref:PaaD-like zinc ribbon domain-containing protein n=1 Tax=Nonomuraea fuscirosea TaxID=1291556 RepID=UPI00346BE0CD